MMDGFTPLGRRLVALSLLLLLVIAAISWIVVPIFEAASNRVGELHDVRQALARTRALRDAPRPPAIRFFPDTMALWAPNATDARSKLVAYVSGRAAPLGLQPIFPTNPTRDEGMATLPRLIVAEFSVTGSRDAIFKLMDSTENGPLGLRFVEYHITDAQTGGPLPMPALTAGTPSVNTTGATPGRVLKLDGRIAALWGGTK